MSRRTLAEMIADAPGGVLLFDGGMGSMIARRGLARPGEVADLLALTAPAGIAGIHEAYVAAGADVITTNTFNANARNIGDGARVADVYAAAVRCARDAGAHYVAGDIGPIGELLEPYGDLEEDDARALFEEQAQAAADAGADLIIIETMSDLAEASLALQAAKATGLPVISTMSFQDNGFTFFGVTPEAAAETLGAAGAVDAAGAASTAGADAVGMNCSTGPETMIPLVERMRAATELPLIAQPNAGLPSVGPDGETVYGMQPAEFAAHIARMLDAGVSIIGGCCGTNPDFIRELDALRRARS